MDLIERHEANKNPNRGLGGLRSPANNKLINRDDKPEDLDQFRRHRPDDVRKKWANKDLDFDDLSVPFAAFESALCQLECFGSGFKLISLTSGQYQPALMVMRR